MYHFKIGVLWNSVLHVTNDARSRLIRVQPRIASTETYGSDSGLPKEQR